VDRRKTPILKNSQYHYEGNGVVTGPLLLEPSRVGFARSLVYPHLIIFLQILGLGEVMNFGERGISPDMLCKCTTLKDRVTNDTICVIVSVSKDSRFLDLADYVLESEGLLVMGFLGSVNTHRNRKC